MFTCRKQDNTVLTYLNRLYERGKNLEYYTIEAKKMPYDCQEEDWEGLEYRTINLFGEEFVLFKSGVPNKLAKLVIDNNTKYTLRTGEILDLGGGYGLEIKQVDIKGDKVWVEFTKDGEFIEDTIIDLEKCLSTWTLKLDNVEEEENVTVLKIRLLSAFKGDIDAIVQIQGLWLIDYQNAFTIEKGDIFGKFEVDEIGSSYLKFKVNET
nr:S-layer protein domain-containing protein [Methanosarcina sp. KYL-1]